MAKKNKTNKKESVQVPALFYCLKRQKERKKDIMKTAEGLCELKTNIGPMPLEVMLISKL